MLLKKMVKSCLMFRKSLLEIIAMELKEAVEAAKQQLIVIFDIEDKNSVRLEEVELNDHSNWVITLSYMQKSDPNASTGLMAIAAAINANTRTYKVVTINKQSGGVESIKIRDNG